MDSLALGRGVFALLTYVVCACHTTLSVSLLLWSGLQHGRALGATLEATRHGLCSQPLATLAALLGGPTGPACAT